MESILLYNDIHLTHLKNKNDEFHQKSLQKSHRVGIPIKLATDIP